MKLTSLLLSAGLGAYAAAMVQVGRAPDVSPASAAPPLAAAPHLRLQVVLVERDQIGGDPSATTSRNAWGVKLAEFRAKGQADRYLSSMAGQFAPIVRETRWVVEQDGRGLFVAGLVGFSRGAAVQACRAMALRSRCQLVPPPPASSS